MLLELFVVFANLLLLNCNCIFDYTDIRKIFVEIIQPELLVFCLIIGSDN
jgi:hypothetical protein